MLTPEEKAILYAFSHATDNPIDTQETLDALTEKLQAYNRLLAVHTYDIPWQLEAAKYVGDC
jgi:hypothetical protein